MQHLTHLSIYSNNIAVFPEKLGTMVSLRFAYLGGNPITSLPHSFGNLVNLHTCWLNSCNLSYIPDSIGNLKGMSRLSLASNELQSLPDSITNLRNMSILWIRENPNLILSAYHLQWIQEIKSSGTTVYDSNIGNQLAAPASGLASFRGKNIAGYEADALKKLEIRLNRELPLLADTETIEWDTVGIRISNGQVTGLGLYSVGLSQFPDEILQLDNLTSLSVYSNEISYLPEEIGDLFQLEYAYLGGNPLTSLPYRIGDLRNLNTCWLNTCQLQSIPDSIGNLGQIYRLSIASNQLTSLPDSIMNLNRMNIFWIRENPNLNLSRKQKKWLNEIENRGTTIYAEGVKR